MNPLYSVKEFAGLVKLHPSTILKKCRLGLIRAKKIPGSNQYRISEDLSKWVAR